jgi:hypothetical protein
MRRKQNLDIIMSDMYLELEQKLVYGEIGTDEFKEQFDRKHKEANKKMLETEGTMLVQDENGTFSEYDDGNDITISCENEEQCEEVIELLKRQFNPVKPIISDAFIGDINWECPLCGRQVMSDAEGRDKYCGGCGCKFDWSEISGVDYESQI